MTEIKIRPLADFEWASVTLYIVYISGVMGLSEINCNHVNSFPLARIGPDKLLKQKERTLALLKGNKSKIERFVGERKSELEEGEISVLRSMYMQIGGLIDLVERHIGATEMYMADYAETLLDALEEVENEPLF